MKPLHAVEVDFHPENSVTTRYKYMSLTHAEKSGIWRLTAAEWTEAVHRHDEKAEFRFRFAKRSSVSVLQRFFVHCSGHGVSKTYSRAAVPKSETT